MPDLSDTVAKCRMGTAKKFYTSIASLSHTSKSSRIITLMRWRYDIGMVIGLENAGFMGIPLYIIGVH